MANPERPVPIERLAAKKRELRYGQIMSECMGGSPGGELWPENRVNAQGIKEKMRLRGASSEEVARIYEIGGVLLDKTLMRLQDLEDAVDAKAAEQGVILEKTRWYLVSKRTEKIYFPNGEGVAFAGERRLGMAKRMLVSLKKRTCFQRRITWFFR